MIEQVAHISWLGWIVFAIVVGSVGFVILAALTARSNPRMPKASLTFIAVLFGLTLAVVVGVWIGGFVFSALMG